MNFFMDVEFANDDFLNIIHKTHYYRIIKKVEEADLWHKSMFFIITGNSKLRNLLALGQLFDFENDQIYPELLEDSFETDSEVALLKLAHLFFEAKIDYDKIKEFMTYLNDKDLKLVETAIRRYSNFEKNHL